MFNHLKISANGWISDCKIADFHIIPPLPSQKYSSTAVQSCQIIWPDWINCYFLLPSSMLFFLTVFVEYASVQTAWSSNIQIAGIASCESDWLKQVLWWFLCKLSELEPCLLLINSICMRPLASSDAFCSSCWFICAFCQLLSCLIHIVMLVFSVKI